MHILREGTEPYFGLPKDGVEGVCLACCAIMSTECREPNLQQFVLRDDELGEVQGWAKPCLLCGLTRGGLVFFPKGEGRCLRVTPRSTSLKLPGPQFGFASILASLCAQRSLEGRPELEPA